MEGLPEDDLESEEARRKAGGFTKTSNDMENHIYGEPHFMLGQQQQAQQQAQAQQQQQQTQQHHHHHHQNQQLQHQNQQQTQQHHHHHHQNQQLQHQNQQQAQQQQNQEEEDIEEDRVSQDGNTSNSDTASEYEHRSEFSSEQSSDSEISEEEEVMEPPQKRQRKDSRTLNTIMLGGTASTPGQPLGTPTAMQHGDAATALTQRVGAAGGPTAPTQFSAETLEDVKKCKNFLSTLIRIVSNGKHSSETTATVKDLVKNLLDAKIEAEEFSSRLARELNSSPQPYLVPFLKRILPALRLWTPDSSAFIQREILEDVKECKKFLFRMIRLASDVSHETTAIVKDLVKNLLDAKIEAEEFSSRLYQELNISIYPSIVPFLKETLEDVKECKNFLFRIIKLASNGKHSSETTATVKHLVKNLLDAKIEAEDFTSRLGRELHVSISPIVLRLFKETLEHEVEMCNNVLSTVIRLASNGKHSSETTANVKELVKNLLDAKIEPEDFNSRLVRELNKQLSPSHLHLFKRILPALRLLTPDSSAFIQQSELPQFPPPTPQRQPPPPTSGLLKEVKKQLADSEEHLRAKDKELEETKAEKTKQERNLGQAMLELKEVKKQLADGKEHLRAKDKELEETKAEKTKQERHLGQAMLELKEVKKQLADSEEHLRAKDKELEETKAEKTKQERHLGLELEEVKKQLADSKEHLRAKDKELEETKFDPPVLEIWLIEQQLADGKEHLRAKDKELEETKAEKTKQERHLGQAMLELKEVKKQLADSEEHLRAKDKELEETKAEKTKQERHLGLELKEVKKQLADSEEHLRAKDKELEETKAEKTKQERHLGLELKEVKQQLADGKEHLRAKDKELEETKEQAQQTQEEMKAELQCSVCLGLFIEPVILNCAHSFCTDCIRKSREVKNECPLCREPVQYQTFNLVMEKCMERIVQRLSPDERAANQDETRETPDPMEVSPAQDMLSPSQDVLYLHASIISPIDGVYSNSPGTPYVNSPAYSNMPTPQSVSSTASENEEPSRSWRPGA